MFWMKAYDIIDYKLLDLRVVVELLPGILVMESSLQE
jgi:hypothetical protein